MSTAPAILTDRLLLRALRVDDFEPFAAFHCDPAANPFVRPTPDRRSAWRALACSVGTWPLLGVGWWAVEDRATGELAGTVGAFFRERQLPIGPDTEMELGWNVFPRFAGRGYATEAARAAMVWAFEALRPPRAIAQASPGNAASRRVAEKLGMAYVGEADYYGEPSVLYEVARV